MLPVSLMGVVAAANRWLGRGGPLFPVVVAGGFGSGTRHEVQAPHMADDPAGPQR